MTNNTPDYNDNLYFEEKKMDCKNCPYTDEYCASGDCNKIQAKDVACNEISLTEQWKKGELPEGVYYCNTGNTVEILFTWGKNYHQLTNNKDEVYIPEMDDCDEIIAPVPSYDEWFKIKNLASLTSLLQEKNIECLHRENKLKELLKECKAYIGDVPVEDKSKYMVNALNLLLNIDEVLK